MSLRDQLQRSLGDAYLLERELGGGGMSRVFVAEDRALGRRVVIKVLPPELTAGVNVERFDREILLAAKLQHPHIVPVLTAGATDGLPWFAMPFVEGESLRARLERDGALPIGETIGLLRDVAKALAYAHEHGIVHRDIKPDNVLLTGGSATVADFGIAKALTASRTEAGTATLTQVGTSIGTPAYMSPEQASGDPATDHRADLYSFGCLAYEMLAGRPPFTERTPQKLFAAHLAQAPEPVALHRPDVPPALAALVMQCLEKDAGARPARAADVVRALDAVQTGSGADQPALPAILLGGTAMFRKALAIWAATLVGGALLAQSAIVGIGLPTWVLPGTVLLMALGLPAILWTGYVQRVARQAAMRTPTRTPGGTRSLVAHGTLATIALKASPRMSWGRTARAGYALVGAFVLVVAGYMGLRAMGVGPEGSLFAAGALAERDRILMTDFRVSGPDSALGRVVSDAVLAGLAPSRVLRLMTPTEIAAALQRMERPVTTRIDLETARAIAAREGVKAIVDGDVTPVGTSYIVAVRLVTADSGRELASYRATAKAPEELITVADALSRKLRARAGESLRSVNAAPPLAQVTTASLEALRRYSEASRANEMEGDYRRALRLLREAVAIDTGFAEGWRKLGVVASNAGLPPAVRDSAVARAFQLRHRLARIDADYVEGSYYQAGVHRDRPKAIAAFERVLAAGDSTRAANNLALLLGGRREFARAETLYRAAIRFNAGGYLAMSNLRFNLESQGKWAEMDSVEREMERLLPGNARLADLRLARPLDAGDLSRARQAVDSVVRALTPRSTPAGLGIARSLAAVEGRLRDHAALSRQGWRLDSLNGNPPPEGIAEFLAVSERVNAGLPVEREMAAFEAALRTSPAGRDPNLVDAVAVIAARAGRPDVARALLADFDRALVTPELRAVRQPNRQRMVGWIAAAEGRWAEAVRELRKSDSLPDGPNGVCSECLPRNLMEVFARAGMADSAMAQYAIYRATPRGSRPRVGPDVSLNSGLVEALARIHDQAGDTARAVELYRDLVTRWERADPEFVPRREAARKRLEALTPVERAPR